MEITPTLRKQILDIIHAEVCPATGCTEPISTALACATLRDTLGGIPDSITLFVSGNLFKNAMAVYVPHTQRKGLKAAGAMGLVFGDASLGLEVLKNIEPQRIEEAVSLEERIQVRIKEGVPTLYVQAYGTLGENYASVNIIGEHTCITRITLNDKEIFSRTYEGNKAGRSVLDSLSLRDIYEIATSFSEEGLSFLQEAVALNENLSAEGLKQDYGLGIGKTYLASMDPKDLQNQILIQTTAAIDARMGGAPLPAMTNSGSGNQGITATLPVVVAAHHLNKLTHLNRALLLSHLTAIYIHHKLPTLSSLCAVSTAGIGSYMGIVWLYNEDFDLISKGVDIIIGDISGILCDGAGSSCALKAATALQSVHKSLLLTLRHRNLDASEGILGKDCDESILNLCEIAKENTAITDSKILEIMMTKLQEGNKDKDK